MFNELGGSFLILGEPGSGKTTSLLELTRDMINEALENDANPIPVVFNLSSWGQSQKEIEDWLVDELNSKYDVPYYVGSAWVEGDELLLLLDGLDEVREECREGCVDAINQYRRRHMVHTVVCSRTTDYEALARRLTLLGAVVQQPLTNKQIDDYLASLGRRLRAVRKAVRRDNALKVLARSPLMLSIIALAYQGTDIDYWRASALEDRRSHLFATYVARMFKHRKIVGDYGPEEIIRRLVWLSRWMKKCAQSEFRIEHLQPTALSSDAMRTSYIRGVGFGVCALSGLSFGLACGIGIYAVSGSFAAGVVAGVLYGVTGGLGSLIALTGAYHLKYRVILGVTVGCAIALSTWILANNLLVGLALGGCVASFTILGYSRIGASTPSESMSDAISTISTARKRLGWTWDTGRIGFVRRLPIGIIFGLAAGLTAGAVFGWAFGLAVAIAFSLSIGVAGSISHGMIDLNVELISKPNEGIWRSLENALRFGAVGGLWAGTVLGCLGGMLTDLRLGLATGCSFFFAGFVLAGLFAGGFTVIQHGVLRLLLRHSEDVPLRYPELLGHAVYHIFLKRVGGGYIFIHRLLLDHFATEYPDSQKVARDEA